MCILTLFAAEFKVPIPGDWEYESEKKRRVSGIPVKPAVINDMRTICEKTGVTFDFNAKMTQSQ